MKKIDFAALSKQEAAVLPGVNIELDYDTLDHIMYIIYEVRVIDEERDNEKSTDAPCSSRPTNASRPPNCRLGKGQACYPDYESYNKSHYACGCHERV